MSETADVRSDYAGGAERYLRALDIARGRLLVQGVNLRGPRCVSRTASGRSRPPHATTCHHGDLHLIFLHHVCKEDGTSRNVAGRRTASFSSLDAEPLEASGLPELRAGVT